MSDSPAPDPPTLPPPGRGRGKPGSGFDGLLLVDKEPGWTSHDVVARCRSILGQRRIGHAGTLDPDATGLLLVGLGRCTRLLRFLNPLPKTYHGEVVLGAATNTLDASGQTVATAPMEHVTPARVREAAARFVGDIDQVPPMVSAVKVGGRRLHALARQGVDVERPARRVSVHRLELTPTPDPSVYRIDVVCSSGTYVRVLAADLGTELGGVAHLRALRRTAIGPYRVEEARPMDQIDRRAVLPPLRAVEYLDQVVAGEEEIRLVARGLPLDRVHLGAGGDGPWALLDGRGELLAVYEATDSDRVTPAVVLAAK
jgi:tRNA pseudouridine55 synthase